jgi:hypothetical protein
MRSFIIYASHCMFLGQIKEDEMPCNLHGRFEK